MIKSVTDKCYICGKNDHFANNCKKVSVKKSAVKKVLASIEKNDSLETVQGLLREAEAKLYFS